MPLFSSRRFDGSFSFLLFTDQEGGIIENKKQINEELRFTKVIFGFQDEETGKKLSAFYKKHTGIDCDFNKIKHYSSGFKLLAFDLPLGKFMTVGITAAGCSPYNVLRFSRGIDNFIYWYEHDYLESQKL